MKNEKFLKDKTIVFVDEANLYFGFKKVDWKIDYDKFMNWLKERYNITEVYYYRGILGQKAYFDLFKNKSLSDFYSYKSQIREELKDLKRMGYKVRTKAVASIYDEVIGDYIRKCNFDVEITINALDGINNYEHMILCSGDGDFLKLIKYLKGHHKRTTIIAHADRINQELKKATTWFLPFGEIKEGIKKDEASEEASNRH